MSDNVEHPSHYNAGGVETIDAIKSALGDGFLDYCRGNVIKYVWRCRHKGDLLEDLRKAAKYLEWAIEAAGSEKPSEPQELAIPEGWRELEENEPLSEGDLFDLDGEWVGHEYDPSGGIYSSRIYCRHIRKIETLEPEPLAIPEGWRELEFGETRLKTDLYSYDGKWVPYTDFDPSGSEFPKYDKRIHHQHIRKIETSSQSKPQELAIPDGWRELNPHDFPRRSDMREVGGSWKDNNTDSDAEYKYWKIRIIRKIEQWQDYGESVSVEEAYANDGRKIETENTSGSLAGNQGCFDDADGAWVDEPNPFDGRKIETANPSHVEGVWVEEADANARKIEPNKTSDALIPDPGPGYRLLSKDPPERVQEGDEFWCDTHWVTWWPSSADCGSAVQSNNDYYRRKIEPTAWIPKVGDKVRVVKPGRLTTGRTGVVSLRTGEYLSVWVEAEEMTSHGLLPRELELIEAAQWIPKVGDKVRVNCPGRIVDGLDCVIIAVENGKCTAQHRSFISNELNPEHLELIEAAQ